MGVKEELETTKMVVESILERYKLARNNDFYLVVQYLRAMGVKVGPIDANDFINLSGSISTVLRCRRVIQNVEKRFLPSKRVREKRRRREQAFRRVKYHEL